MKFKSYLSMVVFSVIFMALFFSSDQIMADTIIPHEQIGDTLKLATEKAAPDQRVSYFNINVLSLGKKIVLSGKVLTEDQKVIAHAAFTNLGYVDNTIEVFPFSDIGKDKSYGIVKSPALHIRGNSKHAAELISQTLMGNTMLILEAEEKWLKVQIEADKYIGWVERASVVMSDLSTIESWKKDPKIMVVKHISFVYPVEDENSQFISKIYYTTRLSLVSQNSNFYKVRLPSGVIGYLKTSDAKVDPVKIDPVTVRNEIVNEAQKFLFTPYLWGGATSVMTDCSGYVQSLYRFYGYSLPRDADQQQNVTKPVNKIEDLLIGDLVFFEGHVGMYIGNMKFIHSSAGLGGVSISSFDPKAPDYAEWYIKNYKGAGRVLD